MSGELTTKRVEAIRLFAAAGFPLIPLNGKKPSTENWPATKPGKYHEGNLKGNYGVVIGPKVVVVDIDPRNFPKGDKPVTRLLKDLGIDLKSFTQKTGGGGLHIFLNIPEGFQCVNDLKAYPGIEFKSNGRQVVGAGSIHPDTGAEYSIINGTPDKLQDAPKALLDAIKAPEPSAKIEENAGTLTYKDDSGTRGRFSSYLTTVAEPSIQGRNGDKNAFRVAAYGRDLGLSPDITWELMMEHWNPRCEPPWDASELKSKVVNAYKYAASAVGNRHPSLDFTTLPVPEKGKTELVEDISWETTSQGGVKVNFNNLLNHMRSPETGVDGVFGFNEFTGRPEFIKPAPWHNGKMPRNPAVTDNDLKLLKAHLAVNHRFEMALGQIEEAVFVTAYSNRFHPVRTYLAGLKWDGKPRLEHWLRDFCGAADDEYTRACARKLICAAVMRVFKPGCKFDHAIVLEGEQGIGKSAICAILGGEWSGDFTVDPHDKDTIQLMQGKWIIELAELEITRRSDNDALKAFISRQTDTARLAYGRLASEFPRQSVFIATKNPGADGTYLKDDTGNRRWWPVALNPKNGIVDFNGLKGARDQIFAEAMARIEADKGATRLDMDTPELRDAARAVAMARLAEHEWTERISTWLAEMAPDRMFLTSREIFLDAMGGAEKQFDRRSALAISLVMKHIGWKRGVKRIGGLLVKGYHRPYEVLGDLE